MNVNHVCPKCSVVESEVFVFVISYSFTYFVRFRFFILVIDLFL